MSLKTAVLAFALAVAPQITIANDAPQMPIPEQPPEPPQILVNTCLQYPCYVATNHGMSVVAQTETGAYLSMRELTYQAREYHRRLKQAQITPQ